MKSLFRLFPYLKQQKAPYFLGMISIVLSSLFSVGAWAMVMKTVDACTEPGISNGEIFLRSLGVFSIFLVGAFFGFLKRWLISGASRRVEYAFRNDFFAQLQRLSPTFYDRHMTGDLMARATNDMAAIRSVLGPGLMYPVTAAILVPAVLVMMINISATLTLYSLLPLAVIPLIVSYFGRRVHARFKKVQEHYSLMSSRIQENITGTRVVKSFARERFEIDAFHKLNVDYRTLNMKLMRVRALFFPLLRIIVILGQIIIIWGGAAMITGAEAGTGSAFTIGGLVAFFGLHGELASPLLMLGWVVTVLERGAVSMDRIGKILDREPVVPPYSRKNQGHHANINKGRIEFCQLSFSYGETPVLKDISLVVEPKKTLGIVGPVGSGKSTLLKLICRLYPVKKGQLFVDDADINDIPTDILRKEIGMVPQEAFLFSDTLHENIVFGAVNPGDEALLEASSIAQLDAAVKEFPDGYDTLIGERGINLSGGQKQRATLARTLLCNTTIVLLDDCLTGVDAETEEKILHALRNRISGLTTLIVSHRISAVASADEIIVLDGGMIVDRGTHSELVSRDGFYARLAHRQQLEAEIENTGFDGKSRGGKI